MTSLVEAARDLGGVANLLAHRMSTEDNMVAENTRQAIATIKQAAEALLSAERERDALRYALDTFAILANAADDEGLDEETVLRVVYDDPVWGDNTVLGERYVRAFRRAREALSPQMGASQSQPVCGAPSELRGGDDADTASGGAA